MTLDSGEEKDQVGTLRLKEWHGVKFPRFSFCLIYPGLGSMEACNQYTSINAD